MPGVIRRVGARNPDSTKWLTAPFERVQFNQMVKSNPEVLDRLFHALSDQTRRGILNSLANGESTVGELAKPYKISLAAVSKHLGVLEAAGLIDRTRVGSFQIVNLRAESLMSANEWLSYYEKFWDHKLDALQDLLERKKK